ncbi:MAG: choline-sulfatase, partial [Chlamydiales bacterium]
ARSVQFESAHSVCSWTLPSVVSIMTSLYPSAHRCTADDSVLAESYVTMAEQLAAQGFSTGAVTSHLYLSRRFKIDQGFQDFDEELVFDDFRESHHQVSAPAVTDKGIAWLRARASDERWFLWLHYFDPHSVYQHHPGVVEPFGDEKLDMYDGEIVLTDLHVGRLLDELDTLALRDQTVVALIADHGEEFRDHGAGGHRKTLYEEVLRVPLLIQAPHVAPRRVTAAVSCVDLAPTLFDLLGVQAMEHGEGVSLVARMHGDDSRSGPILAEMRNTNGRDWDGLIDGRWKYLVDLAQDRQLLFDLDADPLEQSDVSAEHPNVLEVLAGRLEELRARSRERAHSFEPEASIELSTDEVERLKQLGYMGDD